MKKFIAAVCLLCVACLLCGCSVEGKFSSTEGYVGKKLNVANEDLNTTKNIVIYLMDEDGGKSLTTISCEISEHNTCISDYDIKSVKNIISILNKMKAKEITEEEFIDLSKERKNEDVAFMRIKFKELLYESYTAYYQIRKIKAVDELLPYMERTKDFKVVQDESIKKGEQYTISSKHLQEDIKKWNEDFMEADT